MIISLLIKSEVKIFYISDKLKKLVILWFFDYQFIYMSYSKSIVFSSDTTCKMDVPVHDCHSFSVDGAQVAIFKQWSHKGFSCLLESENGTRLEPKVLSVFLGEFPDQSLEGEFPYE